MSGTAYRSLFGLVFLAGLTFGIFTASAFSWNVPDDTNVNSRYTVERIELAGAPEVSLSKELQHELHRLVGQKFSPEAFAKLAGRVRDELRARLVAPKLLRGSSSERIRVVLEVSGRRLDVTASPSRISYHTSQGWSGDLTLRAKSAWVGIVFDGDQLMERTAGLRMGYSKAFRDGRVRPGMQFQTMDSSFHPRTRARLADGAEPYSGFQIYQPDVIFTPWRGADREEVTFTTGLRLQRFTIPSPGVNREASHALVNTLRYQRVWGEEATGESRVMVEYGLASGLGGLGSDYRFERQAMRSSLDWKRGRQAVRVRLEGGVISGDAPLYDRFAYGNTTTLRGWNKFAISPLGATRAIASSVEYGFGRRTKWTGFFDSGSVWNQTSSATVRNSSGVGLRTRGGFFLFVAFPFRSTRAVEAVFLTGAYF